MDSYLERLADRVGRLSTGFAIVGGAMGWILLNVALGALGIAPIERFPFHWLQRVMLIGNLSILFLMTKLRRDRRAPVRRAPRRYDQREH